MNAEHIVVAEPKSFFGWCRVKLTESFGLSQEDKRVYNKGANDKM